MSGSEAMKLQNLVIALGPSSMPSSTLTSNTWAPISTCSLATLSASWGKNSEWAAWGQGSQDKANHVTSRHPQLSFRIRLLTGQHPDSGLLPNPLPQVNLLKHHSPHHCTTQNPQRLFSAPAWWPGPCDLALSSHPAVLPRNASWQILLWSSLQNCTLCPRKPDRNVQQSLCWNRHETLWHCHKERPFTLTHGHNKIPQIKKYF